jgi:hypothetical protein
VLLNSPERSESAAWVEDFEEIRRSKFEVRPSSEQGEQSRHRIKGALAIPKSDQQLHQQISSLCQIFLMKEVLELIIGGLCMQEQHNQHFSFQNR